MMQATKYVTLLIVLIMVAITAFTVQAIVDPSARLDSEPVQPITGNVVDTPEEEQNPSAVVAALIRWILS